MTLDELIKLDMEELAEYLWARLRLEEPLRPPLDRRFRLEPPEDFFIQAWESTGNTEFYNRLVVAMQKNLSKICNQILDISNGQEDSVSDEQLASLAFLAASLDAKLLILYLYAIACVSLLKPSILSPHTLFHVLRAICYIQINDRLDHNTLTNFWESLVESKYTKFRGVSYHGLLRINEQQALKKIDRILTDEQIDLPAIAWYLVTTCSSERLSKVAGNLKEDLRIRLYSALEKATGPNSEILKKLDQGVKDFYSDETKMVVESCTLYRPRW